MSEKIPWTKGDWMSKNHHDENATSDQAPTTKMVKNSGPKEGNITQSEIDAPKKVISNLNLQIMSNTIKEEIIKILESKNVVITKQIMVLNKECRTQRIVMEKYQNTSMKLKNTSPIITEQPQSTMAPLDFIDIDVTNSTEPICNKEVRKSSMINKS